MKTKSTLFAVALLALSSSAFAQTEIIQEEVVAKHGPYLTNRFFDNMFISVGAGGQVYFGEQDTHGSFGKRIAPALDVAIGKWVTPSVGFRLQYSGLQAKGYTTHTYAPYIDGEYKGRFKEKFNVSYLHADILWNFSNAVGGYRPDRFYEAVPYVGFGWARAFKKDRPSNNEIATNIGLLNKFRLSPSFDLNLDLKMMFVNQNFEGVAYGSRGEYLTTASIGFTYKFNKRGFDRPAATVVVDYSAYNARIAALENDLAASNAKAQRLAQELANARNMKPETVVKSEMIVPNMAVFFQIGKAMLTDKELVNLGYVADIMKQSPDKQYTLIGSADKETGTAAWNMQLSKMRAQAVYDALVKLGVNKDQLKMDPQGSTNNQFSTPALNRVVIVENNK